MTKPAGYKREQLFKMPRKSRKYDAGLIKEVQARKAEADLVEEKKKAEGLDIVCNHIAYPSLFNLKSNINRLHINKQPPKGMTGYIYICEDCIQYMNNINPETAKTCFTSLHISDFQKNIENSYYKVK